METPKIALDEAFPHGIVSHYWDTDLELKQHVFLGTQMLSQKVPRDARARARERAHVRARMSMQMNVDASRAHAGRTCSGAHARDARG